ncbi:MAG: hypothetical protein FWC26_07975 [Fibromonadales bacterium]|nr:hypothetical protein [Fibromonadales bacterium]
MNRAKSILTAAIFIAATLVFSCSSDSDNDDQVSLPSSSSAKGTSSSSVTPLSITTPVVTMAADSSWSLTGGALITAGAGIDSVSMNLVDGNGATVALIFDFLPITLSGEGLWSIDLVAMGGGAYAFSAFVLKSCPEGETVEAYFQVKAWAGIQLKTVKSNKITFVCPEENIVIPGASGAFTDTTEVTLGGTGTAGSAADLDKIPVAIYTNAQVTAANANDIDIRYNGTNIYDAVTAAKDGQGNAAFQNTESEAMLVAVTDAEIAALDSSLIPVVDAILLVFGKYHDEDFNLLPGAGFGAATVGAKFLVITSEMNAIIIEVKSKNGTADAVFFVIRAVE